MKYLRAHRDKLLYLVVGGWNTVFGIGLYALMYHLIGTKRNFLLLNIICGELSIINAFICYKFIVFTTKGKFWPELLRFHLAYLFAIALSTLLMWILVIEAGFSPISAQIATNIVVVIFGYLFNRHFTFSKKPNTMTGST